MEKEEHKEDQIDDLKEETGRGLDRRDFLKKGGMGLMTAGLALGGLKLFEKDAFGQGAICNEIIVMGKHAKVQKIPYFLCEPCHCPDYFQVTQRLITTLTTAPSCDETSNLIPDGSIFIARLTRVFRPKGPHGTVVGCHSGSFILKDPFGLVIASGKMKGIDGMTANHLFYADKYCNQPWHDEGCIEGKGKDLTILQGYTLHGNYVSLLPLQDPINFDLCQKELWYRWELHLTICLERPCNW